MKGGEEMMCKIIFLSFFTSCIYHSFLFLSRTYFSSRGRLGDILFFSFYFLLVDKLEDH